MSFLFRPIGTLKTPFSKTCSTTTTKYQPKGRICKKEASVLPQLLVSTSLLKKGSFNKKTKPISKVFNIQKRTFGDKEQELTDKLFKVIETEKVSPERLAKCKVLIEAGADIFAENEEGETVFKLALKQKDFYLLILIKDCLLQVMDQEDNKGIIIYLYDILNAFPEGKNKNIVVAYFLQNIKDITQRNLRGHSILDLAVYKKDHDVTYLILKTLKEKHPDQFLKEVNNQSENGNTLLHFIVRAWDNREDQVSITREFLRFGADINIANDKGITPLILMIQNNAVELVELAAAFDLLPVIDVNEQDELGRTALYIAILSYKNGNKEAFETIEVLLNHGADPTIADFKGITPLLLANMFELTDVENLLFKYSKKH